MTKIFNDITRNAGLTVQTALQGHQKQASTKLRKPRLQNKVVSFVYKGRFYRRQLKSKTDTNAITDANSPPLLPKLPMTFPAPHPFLTPPNPPPPATTAVTDTISAASSALAAENGAVAAAAASTTTNSSSEGGDGGQQQQQQQKQRATWSYMDWFKLNFHLIVMNFGSLCTLTAFTRSDVLELRTCAMTGSFSFVLYSLLQRPIRYGPPLWSSLFGCVNLYKVVMILDERKGKTEDEIRNPTELLTYREHFKPYGVTPKQFEKIMQAGQHRTIPKGSVISREGELIKSVKLIVKGNTRASTLGRKLTVMGSAEGNRDILPGGDSGAWVGEIAFLRFLDMEHSPTSPMNNDINNSKDQTIGHHDAVNNNPPEGRVERGIIKMALSSSDEKYWYRAVTTVVAVDNVELIEWQFEDLKTVLKSSADLHGALTRSMTAAIVGKVLNFMLSRKSELPSSPSTWFDYWKGQHADSSSNSETKSLATEDE
jgi:hypothetical protein